jgi:hypothetical protein
MSTCYTEKRAPLEKPRIGAKRLLLKGFLFSECFIIRFPISNIISPDIITKTTCAMHT